MPIRVIRGVRREISSSSSQPINQDGKRIAHRKLECDLKQVTQFLKPLKPQLQSMAVESTFNWYWLIDGLRAADYPIDLANPAEIGSPLPCPHAIDCA